MTSEDIIEHADALPKDQITINFLTPTRLIFDNHLVKHPNFHVLALRLAERFNTLRQTYSDGANGKDTKEALNNNQAWYQKIDTWAKDIRLVKDETHWKDILSYSARQRKTTPIGGFIGKASYEGDLTHLRELLVWGEVLHCGP